MTDLKQVYRWMRDRHAGASSIAIAMHMTGGWCDGSYPHDPADLGRCLRVLKKFPEWKPRLKEMAKYGKEWKALIKRWDDLSAVMASEVGFDWSKGSSAPLTYKAMKEVLA